MYRKRLELTKPLTKPTTKSYQGVSKVTNPLTKVTHGTSNSQLCDIKN